MNKFAQMMASRQRTASPFTNTDPRVTQVQETRTPMLSDPMERAMRAVSQSPLAKAMGGGAMPGQSTGSAADLGVMQRARQEVMMAQQRRQAMMSGQRAMRGPATAPTMDPRIPEAY
ncbi:MAG: hypothetical protein ACK5VI_10905 [Opitutia bacterium]